MPVVTLTTDFGLKDYYVALIKGTLLRRDDRLTLVDITHQINNYDIVQAAFIFRNAWKSFPEGTIHLLSVNDFYSPDKRFLAIQHEGHYFVGPDNGLLSLIFQPFPKTAFEIPFPEEEAFPIGEIFARTVDHIIAGTPLREIGRPAGDIVQRITFQPVIGPSYIRGAVIHVDNYENAIVNISKTLFDQVGRSRPFALFFKRHDPITKISRHYYDVPVGDTLCLFNSAGFIEIAINMGKAGSLLGLNVEDTVQIDFREASASKE
jgi:S-adenosylmethionine hydrolase